MSAIRMEDAHTELVTVRFLGRPDDSEFLAYLSDYQAVLERGERYAVVYVTEPNAKLVSHRHARQQATWMAEHESALRERCAGVAFVLPSPVMRGVLRMIMKIQPVPAPYEIFEDEAEARRWAQDRLG